MINVKSGASGYIFSTINVSHADRILINAMVRTDRGLEYKFLLGHEELVIKGQTYNGVTAKKTQRVTKENYLDWLREHDHFHSIYTGKVEPISKAPELNFKTHNYGLLLRGVPQIGGTYNGMIVAGFEGILTDGVIFNGNVEFIRN